MLSKCIKFLLLASLILTPKAQAIEVLTGFDKDRDLPVLNEILRKHDRNLGKVKANSASLTGWLDDVVDETALASLFGWTNDIVFSVTDYNTVAWASGTITLANSESYSISGGNTGNMAALTYIYLDIDTSETVLQTSTTATDSVGNNKILVAVAEDNSDTSSNAQYQVFGGSGGNSLFVDNIAANSASTNEFVSNTAQIKDAIIDNAKISDLSVAKLTAGSITSKAITLAVAAGTGDVYVASGKTDFTNTDAGFILGVDDSDSDRAKFYIGDASSYLNWTGTALSVSGSLTATSGTIGGWSLGATTLTAANSKVVLDSSNEKITVGDTGATYITIDGANTKVETSDYVSGALGAGWHVGTDVAAFQNIYARGKITTSVFEKDTVSVIGGNLLVMPGDLLAADMTALDASTLTTAGDTTFAVNDVLRLKDGTDDEWMSVTNIGSAPTYSVTRDQDGQYGADSNPIWTTGTAIVNYGGTGEGGIYMSSDSTPYIDILSHTGSPWPTGTPPTTWVRIGDLNGFLGYSSTLFGIAIGEADKYLKYETTNGLRIKGDITITGGSGIASFSDAGDLVTTNESAIDLDNITEGSTNKFFTATEETKLTGVATGADVTGDNQADVNIDNIADGSTYKKATVNEQTGAQRAYADIDSSGNYIGAISPAHVAPASGAGLYLGSDYMGYYSGATWNTYIKSDGNFKFTGDGTNYIEWEGATLTVRGAIVADDISTGTLSVDRITSNSLVQSKLGAYVAPTVVDTGISTGTTTYGWQQTGQNFDVTVDVGDWVNDLTLNVRSQVSSVDSATSLSVTYGVTGWDSGGGNGDFAVITEDPAYLLFEMNSEAYTDETTYKKVKEVKVPRDGTISISFRIKTNNASYAAYGRVYKNGTGHGTEQTTTSTSYSTKTETLTFTAGDLVQLYIKQANAAATATAGIMYGTVGDDYDVNVRINHVGDIN